MFAIIANSPSSEDKMFRQAGKYKWTRFPTKALIVCNTEEKAWDVACELGARCDPQPIPLEEAQVIMSNQQKSWAEREVDCSEAKTYDEWKEAGYAVRRGSKSFPCGDKRMFRAKDVVKVG